MSLYNQRRPLIICIFQIYLPFILFPNINIGQDQPTVPYHILHGQHRCKGHVCYFQHEFGEVCKTLPRLPDDDKLIRVVKRFHKSIGTMAFSVRKQVVLDSSRYLKQFNVGWRANCDIQILLSNHSKVTDYVVAYAWKGNDHHGFSLPLNASLDPAGAQPLKKLKEKLRRIVGLIVDERSMIPLGILAMMEYRARVELWSSLHYSRSGNNNGN